MSLDKSNHTGMKTSFHHAIACWCDNQAQRDEKGQVGSYMCIRVCVCKTNKFDFLCIKINLSGLAAVRQESLLMHLPDHARG